MTKQEPTLTRAQAQALRAIRNDDPILAVKARIGVTLEQSWVVVPWAAGEPPYLSSEGAALLAEYDRAGR